MEPHDLDDPALRDRAVRAARGEDRFDTLLIGGVLADVATGELRLADIGLVGPLIASVHRPGIRGDADCRIALAEAIDLSTNSAEIRASAYGEFGNLYRAAKGRGYDDAHARMIAGEQVQKHFNLTIGGKEQDIAIKGELSGIGGGSEGSLNNSTQDSSTTKVAKSISPNTPNKEEFPLSFNDKDRGYVDQFLQQLAGNIPAGRGGAAGQLGTKRGMELLAKAAGVDPMTFAEVPTEIKGSAKQLSETIQRAGAIQRLNNTLALHGPIVNQTISKLTDTGSPILNEHIRDLGRLALSNPDLKAFHVALNTIQREYTYLTAGGAQSKAMLPVGHRKI